MGGDGRWLQNLRPAWSVFVKKQRNHFAFLDSLPVAQVDTCQWDVHYDQWIPTFQQGEYEPANGQGGAHCLTACCHDALCQGLALMSNERFRCYKYRLADIQNMLPALHPGI